MIQYLFDGTEINGYLIFAVPEWYIVLAAVGLLLLGGYSMWLANSPQPKPSPGMWALSKVDREARR